MPPKKKKPPLKEDEEDVMDIFGYIDLIQDCLSKAETSELLCLDGISKADIALRQTKEDPDIQCIVLMKRAELLYIAVKNEYDTKDLDDPLDGCIEDCEQVLSKVSSSNGSGKSLHEQASALHEDAATLKKALRKEARAKKKTFVENVAHSVFQRYDPTKALFKHVSKINSYLLQDIVDCYKKSQNICRTCYYKQNRIEQLSVPNRFCKHCKKVAAPLLLIAASKMCDNLAGSSTIAIPPPPKMLMAKINRHKSFQMCKNKDHTICCDKSAGGDTWFGHSIEELVIWTVERHYGCKFSEFIRSHHEESESPNLRLFGEASGPANSTHHLDEFYDNSDDNEYDYYPEDCVFKSVAAIPQALLLNVIELYSRSKDYCKWCYYKDNEKSIVKFDKSSNAMVCSCCHRVWDQVVVIPASSLCWNFGSFEYLPIAPWPEGKPIKDSFEYCQKKDHFRCFRVYIENEFWYPHSVEEMIVWTVERERGCSFPDFIESVSRIPDSLLSSTRTSPNRSGTAATPTNPPKFTPSAPTPNTHLTFKPHPQLAVTTSPSKLTMAQKVAANVTTPIFNTAQSTSTSLVSRPRREFQFGSGTTQTQSGSVMSSTLSQAAAPRPAAVLNNTNAVNTPAAGRYMYPTAPVQGLASSANNMKNYISSIPEFKPSGIVEMTTIGIAITTISGGMHQNAVITTNAINNAGFRLPPTVPPNYRMGSATYEVQVSQTPLPSVISPTSMRTQQQTLFKFLEVNFKNVPDIPVSLLKAISNCFQSRKEVCRLCFYEERVLSGRVHSANTCSNGGHPWNKPILVIPGCTLCDNEPCFERGESVPLPPLPPVATIKKCLQKNHHKCYTKSLKSNEMFAHSVEALVVWIVESEEECSFEEFVAQKLSVMSADTHSRGSSRTPPPNTGSSVSPTPPKPATPIRITPPPQTTNQSTNRLFHPREVEFITIRDVPSELLSGVAECFKSCTFVCRLCFFDSDCKNLIQKVEVNRSFSCPYGHNPWRDIKVIPKCVLCVSPSEWIPVPPLPKHMKQSKNSFVMCKKDDHSTCYAMSKGTNPWFPHTVEEMVIWTVERDTGKEYEDVYKQFLTTPPQVTTIIPAQLKINQPRPFLTGSQPPLPKINQLTTNPPKPAITTSKAPPQYKPPGITKPSKQPSLNLSVHHPPPSTSFLPGDIQSPTLRSDLEEAIKLAHTSLAQSQPSKSNPQPTLPVSADTNSMFGAFPNILTNILPQSTGTSVNTETSGNTGSGYLGLNLYGNSGVPEHALGGFFPALFGGPDGSNFSSSDPYMNSGSFTSFGEHGDIGDKNPQANWGLPVPTCTSQAALHGWMNAPTTSTGESHDTQQLSHDKLKQDNRQALQKQPPKNNAWNKDPIRNGIKASPAKRESKMKSNTQHNVNSVKPKTVMAEQESIESIVNSMDSALPVPRMPNSEPLILEKALEAEGFVKVKSKRRKRSPKKTEALSATIPTRTAKSKPKFTGLDLDRISPSSSDNGSADRLSLSSHGSSSQSGKDHANDETGMISQSSSHKRSPDISDGFSNSHEEHLSSGFEPQLNGAAAMTNQAQNTSSKKGSNVCLVCYESFVNAENLLTHCQSATHCSAVAMMIGGKQLFSYSPPHPKLQVKDMKLCYKHGCRGAPECRLAHAQKQLTSWKQEWTLVRKSTPARGVHPETLPPSVKLTEVTNGLRLSPNPMDSQYPRVMVTSSREMSVTVNASEGSIEWSITLQGQNWQTLFGVYCHAPPSSSPALSLTEPTFKIRSISSGPHSFLVGGPVWEAGSIRSGLLMGRVVVGVVAQVASMNRGSSEKCELRLNLGYKQFLYLPMFVKVEDVRNGAQPVLQGSQPTVDMVNDNQVFGNPRSTVPDNAMKAFQQKWNLSNGSSSSEELGILNIEGEDTTFQHVPIEDWGCSLTEDATFLK